MKFEKTQKRVTPPLKNDKLRALALHYVGRYATTRAKLRTYLIRKIRERGWDDDRPPEIDMMIENFTELGYIDDAGFAEARARSFIRRGFGARRLGQDLSMAGIEENDSANAMEDARKQAWHAAENFARRKHIGPFARETPAPKAKEKQLNAFLRAGHGWDYARLFVEAEPGARLDPPD